MARHARLFLALALTVSEVAHAGGSVLRNWFDDPFFQIAGTMPGCPLPLGPLLTESEMKAESHARAERGTSCWLSGACGEPNAYLYDAGIARHIQENVTVPGAASLWVTVKRRFVWIEGCVERREQASDLENRLKVVPQVERVFVDVMTGVEGMPPYRKAPVPGR